MPKISMPPGYKGDGSEVMLNPWMAGGAIEEGLLGASTKIPSTYEEAMAFTNEFVPWKGAKDLMARGRGALDALKGAFSGPVAGAGERALPLPPKPLGFSGVPRPPSPGGVIEDVLSRAGDAQGAGQDVTPGAQRLMQHYSQLIGR